MNINDLIKISEEIQKDIALIDSLNNSSDNVKVTADINGEKIEINNINNPLLIESIKPNLEID